MKVSSSLQNPIMNINLWKWSKIIIIILLRDVSLGTGDTIHQPGNSGSISSIKSINTLSNSWPLVAWMHYIDRLHIWVLDVISWSFVIPPLVKRLDFQDSFDQLTEDILRPELPWHRRLLLAQNQCQLVTFGSAEAHSHSLTYPEHGYLSATLTWMQ